MDNSNQLTVMYYAVGKKAKVIKIDNTLEAMQELVKGSIEVVPHDEIRECFYVVNENGKNEEMKPNASIYDGHDYIAGDFFVCRTKNEDMASITKEDSLQMFVIENEGGCRFENGNEGEPDHDQRSGSNADGCDQVLE